MFLTLTLHGTAIYADQLTPVQPPELIGSPMEFWGLHIVSFGVYRITDRTHGSPWVTWRKSLGDGMFSGPNQPPMTLKYAGCSAEMGRAFQLHPRKKEHPHHPSFGGPKQDLKMHDPESTSDRFQVIPCHTGSSGREVLGSSSGVTGAVPLLRCLQQGPSWFLIPA